MADYRDHDSEMRSAGAETAAISVDAPEKSEALRMDLSLPFPLLCDTERRVVKDWGIYNSAEKGGIARPSVFVVDRRQSIVYAAVDTVMTRVPAAEIVDVLKNAAPGSRVRSRLQFPSFSDWKSALRNIVKG